MTRPWAWLVAATALLTVFTTAVPQPADGAEGGAAEGELHGRLALFTVGGVAAHLGLPEAATEFALDVRAAALPDTTATAGDYRLLVGVNAPEVLSGQAQKRDQLIVGEQRLAFADTSRGIEYRVDIG